METTIVIIEDDSIIAEGYEFIINEIEGYKVIKIYHNAEDAIKKIASDQPDVILLDIELPGINGIEAIAKLKQQCESAQIIILSVYETQKDVFEALSNGASGYLTKNTPIDKIIAAIDEVMVGGGPMSVQIARMVINSFKRSDESPLTKRETEILEQISNGKTRRSIADEMFIDLETVKSHLKNIYSKLDVHSKADAIKTAKQKKYI